MDNAIQIIVKPDWISWEEIHKLLLKAHQENISQGMIMRTVNMSGEELKERVGDGICFVAVNEENKLIGTGSVVFKNINTWFKKGKSGKLMLGAVLPEYQGRGVYSKLLSKRIEYTYHNGVDTVLMDTAEHNKKMQDILIKRGFQYVGCFASIHSKHYSVIMAKWFNQCPFSKNYCKCKFHLSMLKLKIRYKKGGKKRFGI